MELFKFIKGRYKRAKINRHNKKQLRLLSLFHKTIREDLTAIDDLSPEEVVSLGKAKEFYELLNNAIINLETSIYGTLIATFNGSIDGMRKGGK